MLLLNCFWNSLLILFLSSFLLTKNQPRNLHFLLLFRPFFVSFSSSNIFPFFFHHFFLCSLFPFIFLFISFSFLTFFFLLSLSHVSFLCIFFCFTSFFFSLFCSWSFFHTSSLPFFSSSPYLFFWTEKNQKILWSIFRDENLSLFFEPFLLRCFISCSFPPCVILIPCLFHVLLIISASWYYFSWFYSINLLLGLWEKIVVLFLDKSFKKISLIFSLSLFLKKKKKRFWVSPFLLFLFVFSCMIFKNMLLFSFVF